MVQEFNQEEMPAKVFRTDNGLFQIKVKELTLEKFNTKLCHDSWKESDNTLALRDNLIDRWVMFRTRPVNNNKPFQRADLLTAWDELKNYLFKEYEV